MDGYLIFSHKHRAWWMPKGLGYTAFTELAGVYSQEEALKIVNKSLIGWDPKPDGSDMLPHTVMVREDSYSLVNAVAVATVQLMGEVSRRDEGEVTP